MRWLLLVSFLYAVPAYSQMKLFLSSPVDAEVKPMPKNDSRNIASAETDENYFKEFKSVYFSNRYESGHLYLHFPERENEE